MRSLLLLALAGSLTALAADGAMIKEASELPGKAQALRDKGLDSAEVTSVLTAAKEAKLSAADTAGMLAAAVPLVEKHGPVEKFGDFVKAKLGEGLRGKDLADAIKAKHEDKKMGAASKPSSKPSPKPAAAPTPKPGGAITRPGTRPSGGGKGPGRISRPRGGRK